MTENKANKALRKVIINLVPSEYILGPVPESAEINIDISDKLDAHVYALGGIRVSTGGYDRTLFYISDEAYKNFKDRVEDILDAAIVNTKQRESLQRLLDQAFYDCQKHSSCF